MDDGKLPRRVLDWIPEGRRGRSRPQNTWLQDINKALAKKGLQERDWEDRENWRKIIRTAKRDEVIEEWRKLHNTELHALPSSPDIIKNIKSRRLRWAGHVARMDESRNTYRVLVGRPEGKRPLGRPRRRWEDNIKMDLREVGYDDRDWINLAQDRDQWRAYVRAAMNLRKNYDETDQEEKKELAGARAEKKLPAEDALKGMGQVHISSLSHSGSRCWDDTLLPPPPSRTLEHAKLHAKDCEEEMWREQSWEVECSAPRAKLLYCQHICTFNGHLFAYTCVRSEIDDIKVYGSYEKTKRKANRKDMEKAGFAVKDLPLGRTMNECMNE
ncbi:hypothetical protein ANN_10112 [Periplaneta americana]|uniref:Uncharacterized protein n=1 Tax=Periplaneta americana TaxID=6978 RepID=A0ABQ8TQV4_PERAM|nr:hypothetical protein ANN_10112 [Periplaneta americana]